MSEQLERARRVYQMAPPREAQSAHDYLPAWLEPYVPGLYTQEGVRDPVVWVKLFTPDADWTWYVTECTAGLCFGYVVGFEGEWGSFSLQELAGVRGPFGLRVERDLWWRPRPASEVRGQEALAGGV
jgi:hypothetical protein